ncbi:MAG: hypothetical protein ACFFDI_24990 [Promethearchaeota archaeon]
MSSRRVTQTATVTIMLVLGGNLFAPVATMAEEVPWTKTYNGSGYDAAYDIVQTSDGGYALVGVTSSTTNPADGNCLLVKTDATGVMQWNHTYGTSDDEQVYTLIQTADGGFVLAGTQGPQPPIIKATSQASSSEGFWDFWLVKTDSHGISQWNQTYGGEGYDYAWALIQTTDGGYALMGGTTSYGAGKDDAWLIKTDAAGVAQWNHTYGTNDGEQAYTLIQTVDGGFVFAGKQGSPTSSEDFWLVKTDATGVMQWNHTYGTEDDECVYDLIQTIDGGFMLAGDKRGPFTRPDLWLVKTDATGVVQWNQTYGPTLGCFTITIVQTSDAGYTFARTTSSPGTQQLEGWLTKIASNGTIQWDRRYNQAYITSLILTSDEGFAMAGMVVNQGTGADFLLIRTTDTGVLASEFQTPETSFLLYALWLSFLAFTGGSIGLTASKIVYARYRKWRQPTAKEHKEQEGKKTHKVNPNS